MIPPQGAPAAASLDVASAGRSAMDAVVRGTADGLALLLNIVALLIVLVAIVTLINLILATLPSIAGAPITLQRALGVAMAPLVWLAGVPWTEAATAGELMGTKTVLNEFIAYVDLAALPPDALSERSRLIMVYALCGFANFGSLGILIGGLTAMVPERRDEVLALGVRSLVSGTLATLATAATVGLLI
jgi:CNT family concentrative nucleoside transporter